MAEDHYRFIKLIHSVFSLKRFTLDLQVRVVLGYFRRWPYLPLKAIREYMGQTGHTRRERWALGGSYRRGLKSGRSGQLDDLATRRDLTVSLKT